MLHMLLDSTLRSTLLGALVWVGLKVLRTRSPALQSVAWTMVLLASLSMPMLDDVARLAAPARLAVVTLPEPAVSLSGAMSPIFVPKAVSALVSGHAHGAEGAPALVIDWSDILAGSYLLVAGILLMRLLVGIALTWRLRRAARPLEEAWVQGSDIRTSPLVAVPVTFGSTILLPTNAADWSAFKRAAVLSHERAHIERGDFYVQLFAGLNRAVFWFNPFAWWLASQLADLAEAASDDAAITTLGGGISYTEILLDVAAGVTRVPAGVAMARPGLVGRRIERILAMAALPVRATRWQSGIVAAILIPLIALAAVAVADPAASPESKPVTLDAKTLDLYVGNYEFDQTKAPNLVITISRDGDHLYSQTNSGPKLEIFAISKGVFFMKGTEMRAAFEQSGDAPATGLKMLTHPDDPVGFDKGVARRVDEAELKRANEAVAQNAAAQAKPHTEVAVDPKIFDRYAGKYQFAQTLFTVTHEGDYLFIQVNSQPKFRVFPENDHEFFYKIVPAEVTFVANGSGPATQLIHHQNGHDAVALRVDEAAAKKVQADIAKRVTEQDRPRTAVKIDPKILDDYVGHYQLAPNFILTVSRQGDQLVVEATGQKAIEVYPENDHDFFYTVVNAQISFIRDDKGRATELVLHQNGQDLPAAKTN